MNTPVSVNSPHSTHRFVPSLNIVQGVNPDIKISYECKDFDPIQQMRREEVVDCPLYFFKVNVGVAAWNS